MTTPAETRNIMAQVASAFIALRDGSNRVDDFNTLCNACNIGIVRAESVSTGAVEVFRNAIQVLLRANQTFDSLKVFVFTPADKIDLAKAVAAYGEILATTSEAALRAAIAEAERRLASGIHARLQGTQVQ
jgi:hypothetical protein